MMNKLKSLILSLLALTLLLTGCSAQQDAVPHSASVTPVLTVTGDVENELTLTDYASYMPVNITQNGQSVPAIPLRAVLDTAVLKGEDISLFLASPDGVMAKIPLSDLGEDSVLTLTSQNGWQFVSDSHPPQSRIRHMDKIVVSASQPGAMERCVRIIYEEQSLTLTYGQLFTADALIFSGLEGQAQLNGAATDAYTRRALIPLDGYLKTLGAAGQHKALAYLGDGSQAHIDANGFLEWRGNSADYIGADKTSRIKDVIGIWLDPPLACVTDIAPFALEKAQSGNVLVILLDGVGYYNLLEHVPTFLSSHAITPMRTVMPSISNVALAAIVTGALPSENGVTERKTRMIQIDDMFNAAAKLGKKCAVVEGFSQLVSMSLEQTLNPDTDGDGYTDDEVQKSALKKIRDGVDFLFVHFHGFDDAAHTYGPSSVEAAKMLLKLDGFVAELCGRFDGTVIITADHGQHDATGEKKGEHGEFLPVDMTVPFIIIEKR